MFIEACSRILVSDDLWALCVKRARKVKEISGVGKLLGYFIDTA